MNTIEQQGDEMVERYLRLHWRMTDESATRCAIRSCEDTIEVLNGMLFVMAVLKDPHDEVQDQIAHQKKIIEHLKTKFNG